LGAANITFTADTAAGAGAAAATGASTEGVTTASGAGAGGDAAAADGGEATAAITGAGAGVLAAVVAAAAGVTGAEFAVETGEPSEATPHTTSTSLGNRMALPAHGCGARLKFLNLKAVVVMVVAIFSFFNLPSPSMTCSLYREPKG